jgi:hypothetical protein
MIDERNIGGIKIGKGNPKINLPLCHSVHYISHMNSLGIESGPRRWTQRHADNMTLSLTKYGKFAKRIASMF